jgi:hypothetical protein
MRCPATTRWRVTSPNISSMPRSRTPGGFLLFQAIKHRPYGRGQAELTGERLDGKMVRRRARAVAITTEVCNDTFRGTGITAYLENGGTLEKARQMAAQASTRATQLYDRREDRVSHNAR